MPNMEAIVLVVAEISAFIPTGIIQTYCLYMHLAYTMHLQVKYPRKILILIPIEYS